MDDHNFRPLFRNCLDHLSPTHPNACHHTAHWDVSRLTNCSHLFWKPTYDGQSDWMLMAPGAELFNVDISRWNTSACTTMKGMLYGASSFNQPIQDWDTSRATDMSEM
jgi:surface protein